MILPYLLYTLALVACLMAGRVDIAVMDALEEMTNRSRFALRLTATGLIEAMEAQFLEAALERGEERAKEFDEESKSEFYKSNVDQVYAERDRKRAEYFQQYAVHDFNLSVLYTQKVQQEEQMRADILRNITRDEQEKSETLRELDQLHSGLCGVTVLDQICGLVGGVTDLQRKADEESLRLVQEYQAKENVTRREFMDNIVAVSFAGKAATFNKTATELLQAAEYWEAKSKEDFLKGIEYNKSGTSLHESVDQLKDEEVKEVAWEKNNLSLAEKDWMASEKAYERALRLAVVGSFLAIAALSFFLAKTVTKSMRLAVSFHLWCSDARTTDQEFWRCLSYCFVHLFIFLFCIGAVGDYLGKLYHFEWNQRSVIFTWFSFVGASLQTISLHTIPHASAEWPLTRRDCFVISKLSFFRLISLMILFAVEVLFAWVNFNRWMFSPEARAVFGHPIWCITTLFVVSLHVTMFEPRGNVPVVYEDESRLITPDLFSFNFPPAVVSVSGRSIASEITPLTSVGNYSPPKVISNSTGPTVAAFREFDLSPEGHGACSRPMDTHQLQCSAATCSPYTVDLRRELQNLFLPIELLFVTCMVAVLIDCLPLANHFLLAKIGLICFIILLTIAAVLVRISLYNQKASFPLEMASLICHSYTNSKNTATELEPRNQIEIVAV